MDQDRDKTDRLHRLLAQDRLVPVIKINQADAAPLLGRVLVESGFQTAEITLRTPASLAALAAMAGGTKELLVGAGTVTKPEQIKEVVAAGAAFGVSPGFIPAVALAAREAGLPFIPGVATPTEAMAARELGFTLLKVFPANLLGGPQWIEALHGALGHTGLSWLPTGGINPENLQSFLATPGVIACGGTWMTPAPLVASEDWSTLAKMTRTARTLAAKR